MTRLEAQGWDGPGKGRWASSASSLGATLGAGEASVLGLGGAACAKGLDGSPRTGQCSPREEEGERWRLLPLGPCSGSGDSVRSMTELISQMGFLEWAEQTSKRGEGAPFG